MSEFRFDTSDAFDEDYLHFYGPLLAMADHLVAQRFVRPAHRAMLLDDDVPERLLARLEAYDAPEVTKWLTSGEA